MHLNFIFKLSSKLFGNNKLWICHVYGLDEIWQNAFKDDVVSTVFYENATKSDKFSILISSSMRDDL